MRKKKRKRPYDCCLFLYRVLKIFECDVHSELVIEAFDAIMQRLSSVAASK